VEVRRQEIIDTARRLFTENGFDKTAITEIARTLDIAQGLIYHYFASKTELLYAVVDQIAGEELEQTNAAIAAHPGTALECLEILFRKTPQPEDHEELFRSLKRDPGIIDYISKKFMLSGKPTVVQLIERGNADGSWNCLDADFTAEFILQGMHGVAGYLHSKLPDSDGCYVRTEDPITDNATFGTNTEKEQLKQTITGIIFRILGVPGTERN
jgi:AcrR family transcriptional regulator